nr:ATP-binding cassette transporter Abcc1-4 [Brachionus angularis]
MQRISVYIIKMLKYLNETCESISFVLNIFFYWFNFVKFMDLNFFFLKKLNLTCKKIYILLIIYKMFILKQKVCFCLSILNEFIYLLYISVKNKNDFTFLSKISSIFMINSNVIAIGTVNYERIRGLPSSGLMFTYWATYSLSSIILIYSEIVETINYNEQFNLKTIYIFVYCALIYINLILSCLPENHSTLKQRKKQNYNSQYDSGIVSRLIFSWLNGIIIKGNKKDLNVDDIMMIDDQEKSEYVSQKLELYWNTISQKLYLEELSKKHTVKYKNCSSIEENSKFLPNRNQDAKLNTKKPSLLYCLFRAFYGKFLFGSFLKLVRELLVFVSPIILGKLISFIKNKNEPIIIGIFYSVLLFITAIIQSVVMHQYFDRMFNVGTRIKTALMHLIYKKSLRLSNTSRKESTVGQMVNIIAVNAQSFVEAAHHLNAVWSSFLSIFIAIFLLWLQLGIASIAGVLVMVIIIPVNSFLMNKSKKTQIKKLKHQDSRIKIINELLNGIKIIKLYAWEICFKKIVNSFRNEELKMIKNISYLNVVSTLAWTIVPFLVSSVSFGIFLLMNDTKSFTPEAAFVSLSLFNAIKHPMSMLPNTISVLIQANVSLKRITEFLLKEEINQHSITSYPSDEVPVSLENCDFGWDYENLVLKDLSFKIKKNNLVAILGSVGQGKSSLLSALIGEMEKFNGKINVYGKIAYAPQQPWIQNASIRENILFGKQLKKDFYQKVLTGCSLISDLEVFQSGDLTEIGEKGINLSGGQKQRISLARCVYSDSDLYLLDDPLSAVDSHVGSHIFDSVIGPKGILNNKTRIFVTNSLNFLPQTDHIIFLENGSIVDSGSYQDLLNKNGPFTNFMKKFLDSKESNKEELENKIIDVLEKNEKKAKLLHLNSKINDNNGKNLIQVEKIQSGKVKSSILINYFRACNIKLVLVFYILYSTGATFVILSNFWLSDWTNNPNNTKNEKSFKYGIYFLLGFLNCIFVFSADILFTWMFTRASKNLHESLLHSILRCGMQFFESTPIGRILNRFSKDIEATETKIPETFKTSTRNGLNVLSIFIVIVITTPLFLIVLVPILILYFLIQRFYIRFSRQMKRLESVSRSPIYAFFGETLNGVSTIRAFKFQEKSALQMHQHLDNNSRIYYTDMYSNRWLGFRLEFTGSIIILFASLFAVLQKDSLSPGTVGLSISYSLTVSNCLMWMVRSFSDFESNLISVERIREYCELPHESEWVIEDKQPSVDWPENGNINFNNYSVKYREELDFVLKDINCTIKPGEKIGIVGRTGAGKSSLTLGLFRILESNYGQIDIDGLNIKTIGLHDLRKKLTIIPQDPVLFSGSLRINLDPFEEYSNDRIWNALEHAHLKEFVQKLDKQLDFECSEGGENLSVGQRQLICLARALLRKTKILILDEATASIDHNTDDLIQQTIRTEFKDCTVLTIAHRLNTILDSNRIMVLDKGKIAELDSPKNLLEKKTTIFYSMAQHAGLT